jgi:hypothetical protein
VNAARLYLRCVGWGLETGAVVGGAVGWVIGIVLAIGTAPALVVFALALGMVYGAILAVVPSVLGGAAVVVVLTRRHPRPASFARVQKELGVVFASVVVALDVVVLVYWLMLGGSLSQLAVELAALLLVDAAVAAMLKPARASIACGWVGDSGMAGVVPVGDERHARRGDVPTLQRRPQMLLPKHLNRATRAWRVGELHIGGEQCDLQ